jgi:hypothetical protein
VPALEPNPLDAEALVAAELWVRRPDEASRRATMEIAQKGGFRRLQLGTVLPQLTQRHGRCLRRRAPQS